MRAIIKKDEGFPERGTIKVNVHVELSAAELGLIRKYKAGSQELLKFEFKHFHYTIDVARLIDGIGFIGDNINQVVEAENFIHNACANLKTLLDTMKNFGNEEVFEY